MALDIKQLEYTYFWSDLPVVYKIAKEDAILIHPVALKDCMLFLSCCDILSIRKNEIDSIDIIKMSYLEFLTKEVFKNEKEISKLVILLRLCLKIESPFISHKDGKYYLEDKKTGVIITAKQFDDIRRIIMYQNIIGYDDSYINPELRASIEETKALKSKGISIPSIERKIAIITSHCGLSKKEQMEMTYRSHELLFQEVSGEIEFITARPVALYSGNGDKIDHWIYKKEKGKFDDYFSSVESVKSKLGNGIVST